MKVDNTILEKFTYCPLGYMLRHEQGWTKRGVAAPLNFGQALHLGLAEWYRTAHLGLGHDERLRRAEDHILEGWPKDRISDDYRNLDKCIDTMRLYARNYPSEAWNVVQGVSGPMVEIPFCLPLGAYLDCQSCGDAGRWKEENPAYDMDMRACCPNCGEPLEPIEYGGLIDAVIEHSGSLYVMDHKTTSQLGPSYFTQYRPNAQMTGYQWGAEQLSGRELAGIYINAIGVFAKGPTRFERQPTGRTHDEVAEWRRGVITKCNAIARAKRTGEYAMHEHNCVGKYGPCEFLPVHSLPTADDRRRVLEADYEIRPWEFDKEDR